MTQHGTKVVLAAPLYRPCGDRHRSGTGAVPVHSRRREDRGGRGRSGIPDPIPIVLLPGFEYRMREWRHPDTHEIHWRLERRRSTHHAADDE